MSTFNTSTRKDDLSMKLRTQNMKYTKSQTKKLEEDSKKMEERLKELKTAMSREKEERERQGGGFWDRGQMYTGSLTNYATEVLKTKSQNMPREGKKKKIKVLQDEPIELPQRSSQPGTMKYIAQRKMPSGPSPREKQKGPKCGQCEERSATLSCVQCSEMFCAGCFAAFHLKGALKKHRSVPISASGPRVCMSPKPSIGHQSPRGSQASGSISHFEQLPVNGSEAAGPHATPSTPGNCGPSLLQGDYNESDSAASFQEALKAWRHGDSASPPEVSARSSRPIASPVKSPIMSVDSSTGTVERPQALEIKFKASLSYAEKLMLKKHRRTELSEVSTPRLTSQSESPHLSESSVSQLSSHLSSRGGDVNYAFREEDRSLYRDPSFVDAADDRVDFHSLFEAVTSTEGNSPDKSLSETSLLKPIYGENPPVFDSSSTYLINEVSPLEGWETDEMNKGPLNSSTFVVNQSKSETHLKVYNSSQGKLDSVNDLYSSQTPLLPVRKDEKENQGMEEFSSSNVAKTKKPRRQISAGKREVLDDGSMMGKDEPQPPAVTPVTKTRPKSVRAKSAKSRPVSRAQSRAQSRAASRLGAEDGVLTKAPSQALSQIASMAQNSDFVYQSPMEGFFMVGVEESQNNNQESGHTQPRPQSRGQTLKSARGDRDVIKVSNRLYQMAPRSWRPDNSLGQTIPLEDVHVQEPDPDMVLAYSYSGQLSGSATEWRPSSSQSRISMPGDDLGLGLQGEMADELLLSQRAKEFDPTNQSQDYSSTTSRSGTPRRKSANRHSSNSATPVNQSRNLQSPSVTPTPVSGSLPNEDWTMPRARSFHQTRSTQRQPSSLSEQASHNDISLPVQSGVSEVVSSQSRSQTRIGSSRAGSRLGVDILPSKSDFASSHLPSKTQLHSAGKSSSRQVSRDSFKSSNQTESGSRPREDSHLSSKSSSTGLGRRHSDIDQSLRPASSTHVSHKSSQKTRQDEGKQRPNSSTGGNECGGSSRVVSHSIDTDATNDTVIADMLADRVYSDVWTMGNNSQNLEENNIPSSTHSKAKSKHLDSGHWETEVIPFARESSESRQSFRSVRDPPTQEKRIQKPLSSRPSSTMSGRVSQAIVVEGDDLSLYDQLGQEMERDHDDEEALDKLEWELASDTGRLTGDGKISRQSVLEPDEEINSRSSSRSSSRSLRMSKDNSYDISAKLQEDDRLAQQDFDELNLRRSMTMDEDDVKALT